MTEIERVQSLFDELQRRPATYFPSQKNAALDVPTEHGVYVIEDAIGKVLHVGRTTSGQGGLQQRLYDHMYATSSFAHEYTKVRGMVLCGSCRYRYLEVPDARLRGFLEYFAIGRLCPEHFGVG